MRMDEKEESKRQAAAAAAQMSEASDTCSTSGSGSGSNSSMAENSSSRCRINKTTTTLMSDADRLRQLLSVIAKVQRTSAVRQQEEPRAVFGTLLENLLELMESEYGFIGEVKHYTHEETGQVLPYLQTHAITNIAWNSATRQFYQDNVQSGLKFYNMNSIFGKVITSSSVMIVNDPKNHPSACGTPKGHPPLNHFLGIPFFDVASGALNGMVGVANKPGGYSQADVDFLEPFTITCSNLIQSYNACRRAKELETIVQEQQQQKEKEVVVPPPNQEEEEEEQEETEKILLQVQDKEEEEGEEEHSLGQQRRVLLEQLQVVDVEGSEEGSLSQQHNLNDNKKGRPKPISAAGRAVSAPTLTTTTSVASATPAVRREPPARIRRMASAASATTHCLQQAQTDALVDKAHLSSSSGTTTRSHETAGGEGLEKQLLAPGCREPSSSSSSETRTPSLTPQQQQSIPPSLTTAGAADNNLNINNSCSQVGAYAVRGPSSGGDGDGDNLELSSESVEQQEQQQRHCCGEEEEGSSGALTIATDTNISSSVGANNEDTMVSTCLNNNGTQEEDQEEIQQRQQQLQQEMLSSHASLSTTLSYSSGFLTAVMVEDNMEDMEEIERRVRDNILKQAVQASVVTVVDDPPRRTTTSSHHSSAIASANGGDQQHASCCTIL